MYITVPARDRNELWVADIDGGKQNQNRHGGTAGHRVLGRWTAPACLSSRKTCPPEKPATDAWCADGSGLNRRSSGPAAPSRLCSSASIRKTVYLNSLEKSKLTAPPSRKKARRAPFLRKKLSDNCGFQLSLSLREGSTCSLCWWWRQSRHLPAVPRRPEMYFALVAGVASPSALSILRMTNPLRMRSRRSNDVLINRQGWLGWKTHAANPKSCFTLSVRVSSGQLEATLTIIPVTFPRLFTPAPAAMPTCTCKSQK